jgi:BACON domain-containing protein/HYDIN/CFA65/VesB family protein
MKLARSTPCVQWAEKLAARHPDDLSRSERIALQEHLLSCPACASTAAFYTRMETGLRNLPLIEPKHPLSPALLEAQSGKKRVNSRVGLVTDNEQQVLPPLPFSRKDKYAQSAPRIFQLTGAINAVAAIFIVGVILSGFIGLFLLHHVTTGKGDIASTFLQVSTKQLNFGDVASDSTSTLPLTLYNSGKQELHWNANIMLIGWMYPWLTLDKNSGTIAPGVQQTIQITADTSQMPPSSTSYSTFININSNGGNYSVPVTLTVPSSCVSINPQSLSFTTIDGQNQTRKATISNNCSYPIVSWSIGEVTNDGLHWLTVSPTSITLPRGASQDISIIVTGGNLGAGGYTGQVIFTESSQKVVQTVTVRWVILPQTPG